MYDRRVLLAALIAVAKRLIHRLGVIFFEDVFELGALAVLLLLVGQMLLAPFLSVYASTAVYSTTAASHVVRLLPRLALLAHGRAAATVAIVAAAVTLVASAMAAAVTPIRLKEAATYRRLSLRAMT